MCNACKTYKRILGLCGKFWYLLSAVLIVFFIDNPYPALADLGNSAAGDDQLALVLAGLDLNNRPVQILKESASTCAKSLRILFILHIHSYLF